MSNYQSFRWDKKPPRGSELDRSHPLAKGLVGYWSMQEGAGEFVNDISGFGNKGTLTNGPTWQPGKFGSALNFDGTNDYVDIAGNVDVTGTRTVSLWMLSRDVSQNNVVLYFVNSGSEQTDYIVIGTYVSAILASADNVNAASAQSSTISSNKWTHVTVTKTTADVTDIYINGVVNTQAGTNQWGGAFAKRLFGDSYVTATLPLVPFNGLLDDVRIYNRALSAGEIRWLYQEPFAIFKPPAIRRYWWDMSQAGLKEEFAYIYG